MLTASPPCTAIWQQPLQSVLALQGCSAMDLFVYVNFSVPSALGFEVKPKKNSIEVSGDVNNNNNNNNLTF